MGYTFRGQNQLGHSLCIKLYGKQSVVVWRTHHGAWEVFKLVGEGKMNMIAFADDIKTLWMVLCWLEPTTITVF